MSWVLSEGLHNVMCKSTGTPIYATKFTKSASVLSAKLLFVDNKMLQQLKKYTETETRRVLETDNCTVTVDELYALYSNSVMLYLYVVKTELVFITCGQIHGVRIFAISL